MKLDPVRQYRGTQYPTLAEFLRKGSRCRKAGPMALGAGLAALAVLMGGCSSIS